MLQLSVVTVSDSVPKNGNVPKNGSAVGIKESFVHITAVIGDNTVLGEGVRIGPFAFIDDKVEIGDGAEIGPHVSVGQEVKIGAGTTIHAHVTIRERVRIGKNVTINSGSVIGSDGFGFANNCGVNHKIPQMGTVEIEDDVWIGSNVAIDRATLGKTRIGRGARIDNLVQVGHNVDVGAYSIIRSKVGIAGSTTIGAQTYVGEQVGIIGHINIGRGVTIHPFAGITKGLDDGASVMGAPARPVESEQPIQKIIQELPDLMRDFQAIKRMVSDKPS